MLSLFLAAAAVAPDSLAEQDTEVLVWYSPTALHFGVRAKARPGTVRAVLEGRLFTLADSGGAPPVVVVSRAWATKYYPNQSPLGKQMYGGGCTGSSA